MLNNIYRSILNITVQKVHYIIFHSTWLLHIAVSELYHREDIIKLFHKWAPMNSNWDWWRGFERVLDLIIIGLFLKHARWFYWGYVRTGGSPEILKHTFQGLTLKLVMVFHIKKLSYPLEVQKVIFPVWNSYDIRLILLIVISLGACYLL